MQMLAALRNSPDSMSMSSMKDYVDPNMMDLYPHDCVFKVLFNIYFRVLLARDRFFLLGLVEYKTYRC